MVISKQLPGCKILLITSPNKRLELGVPHGLECSSPEHLLSAGQQRAISQKRSLVDFT